jgi:hypothetical protein
MFLLTYKQIGFLYGLGGTGSSTNLLVQWETNGVYVNGFEQTLTLLIRGGGNHRHLSNIDCLSFVMCQLLAPLAIGFLSFFFFLLQSFTILMKQTRQAVRAVKQSIFLRCLWVEVKDIKLLMLWIFCKRFDFGEAEHR